jgi:PhzF family phenazine biosynthesis protein
MAPKPTTHKLRIFAAQEAPHGGNPLTIILDAKSMSDAEMQNVAKKAGHESGFILPIPEPNPQECDFEFRFWVPKHEMEMCGMLQWVRYGCLIAWDDYLGLVGMGIGI